jgi:hypothetical protein
LRLLFDFKLQDDQARQGRYEELPDEPALDDLALVR